MPMAYPGPDARELLAPTPLAPRALGANLGWLTAAAGLSLSRCRKRRRLDPAVESENKVLERCTWAARFGRPSDYCHRVRAIHTHLSKETTE